MFMLHAIRSKERIQRFGHMSAIDVQKRQQLFTTFCTEVEQLDYLPGMGTHAIRVIHLKPELLEAGDLWFYPTETTRKSQMNPWNVKIGPPMRVLIGLPAP